MTDEPTAPPISASAEAQADLNAAAERFDQINAALPGGMPPFQLPPHLSVCASVDVLQRMLFDAGLVDEQDFVDAKARRMAELVDQVAEGAREAKRQVMGLVVAQAGQAPRAGL